MNSGIVKKKKWFRIVCYGKAYKLIFSPIPQNPHTHAIIVRHNTHSLYKMLVHAYTTLFHCRIRNLYLFLHGDGSTKGALTLLEFLTNVLKTFSCCPPPPGVTKYNSDSWLYLIHVMFTHNTKDWRLRIGRSAVALQGRRVWLVCISWGGTQD